jgi:hypothetical protein
MFFCKKLNFNQFVAGLKYIGNNLLNLGVTIETEEDFERMFHFFD